jgi:hypothetical protein
MPQATKQRKTGPHPPPLSQSLPEFVPPLYGTPRNLSRETLGHEVAEVGKRLRKPLMPWQSHVADVALEVDPATGELWYEEVIVTVPRQSGKTTLILALMIWRCVMMARRLGESQTVTYIAQRGKNARRKLEREFIPMLRRASGFTEMTGTRRPPTRPTEWKPSLNNGSENILFGSGSYLQIEAPTETGSHGDVIDMPVIDEAFSRPDDSVEQATDAASVTRRSPQNWIISTAGNSKSRFLYRKVLSGRRSINDPLSRSAYFEWSLPMDLDWTDSSLWARYLPALGWTITLARLLTRLAKARATSEGEDEEGFESGEPGFRRGYLNQWVEIPDLSLAGVNAIIPLDVWGALVDLNSQPLDPLVLAYDVAEDRSSASIGVRGLRADGLIHLEVIDTRPGTDWVIPRLVELRDKHKPTAIARDPKGPGASLDADAVKAGLNLTDVSLADMAAACGALYDAVLRREIRHRGQVAVSTALASAVKRPVGEAWVFSRSKSGADVSPVVSLALAFAAGRSPARRKSSAAF